MEAFAPFLREGMDAGGVEDEGNALHSHMTPQHHVQGPRSAAIRRLGVNVGNFAKWATSTTGESMTSIMEQSRLDEASRMEEEEEMVEVEGKGKEKETKKVLTESEDYFRELHARGDSLTTAFEHAVNSGWDPDSSTDSSLSSTESALSSYGSETDAAPSPFHPHDTSARSDTVAFGEGFADAVIGEGSQVPMLDESSIREEDVGGDVEPPHPRTDEESGSWGESFTGMVGGLFGSPSPPSSFQGMTQRVTSPPPGYIHPHRSYDV